MGLDASAHMIIGIRVRREDLFENTGTEYRCERGHTSSALSPFCPRCGSKVTERSKEAARPAFAEYAAAVGKTSEDIWAGEGPVSVHCVDGIQGSEEQGVVHAIGERIGRTESHRRGVSAPCGASLADLMAREDRIRHVARRIGVPEPHTVEVFVCAYMSY